MTFRKLQVSLYLSQGNYMCTAPDIQSLFSNKPSYIAGLDFYHLLFAGCPITD